MISENPSDKNEPGIDASRESIQQSRDSKPDIASASNVPDTPPASFDEQKAKTHRKERREKVRFAAELIVGFFVILYTLVSAALWLTARNANRIANQSVTNADMNFRRDERAWMAFKFVEGNLTFTLNKSFLVPTELVNVGKTPAKNVHGNIVVGVFKGGEPLDFTYTSGHANYKIMAGTIFPNGKIVESFEAIKHGQERAEAIIFARPLKDELFSCRSFIVVHGRIEYDDIFGRSHWTTYCRYVLHTEAISEECTRYNDTDDR